MIGLILWWRVDELDVRCVAHPVFELSSFVVRDVGEFGGMEEVTTRTESAETVFACAVEAHCRLLGGVTWVWETDRRYWWFPSASEGDKAVLTVLAVLLVGVVAVVLGAIGLGSFGFAVVLGSRRGVGLALEVLLVRRVDGVIVGNNTGSKRVDQSVKVHFRVAVRELEDCRWDVLLVNDQLAVSNFLALVDESETNVLTLLCDIVD